MGKNARVTEPFEKLQPKNVFGKTSFSVRATTKRHYIQKAHPQKRKKRVFQSTG